MQIYLKRLLRKELDIRLKQFPVTAILGPRQCGKSTLAKHMLEHIPSVIYLDLERNSDLNKLSDPELFFHLNMGKLICLDEIQRYPEIFKVLRSMIDKNRVNGRFMILGSASPGLLRQSSESLAGRIAYLDLTPFTIEEIPESNLFKHWLRGGFPDSFLVETNEQSMLWRENFIRTFLERDIPSLGFKNNPLVIRRLMIMLAHNSGQIFNSSKLAASLGISHPTVKTHLDILVNTYMVRSLSPYFVNIKKRLIKSPKVYIRDSGILHSLLGIETYNDLLGHPVFGSSWESYAVEQVSTKYFSWNKYFYRTAAGAEIDMILEKGIKKIAVEFKASTSPKLTTHFYTALEDLGIKQSYVIVPLDKKESYQIHAGCTVCSLEWFLDNNI